ncbi:hypothetical protein EI74_0453 [Mycoplasma testudineum]|uniref:Uncharacterized protein n=1 Tax=Mycoplasma testudineum TaxID=244584 RepID=A0A4R6IH70_9MOLU|nr:hypothetical protein [Mycoplasma testudineum]OYD26841.1 hypothetical protein CG473_01885 [Mycoplasma testudineum]TDO20375.1 hypothetical protein EI74_0453 [Mycoplasma testudineum]
MFKIKIFALGTAAIATLATPVLLSVKSTEEMNVEEINKLLEYKSPLTENEYINVSKLAQNSKEILNWVKNVDFNTQSFKFIKNSLFNLNIDLELKKFMNKNLDEKYHTLVLNFSSESNPKSQKQLQEIEINKAFAEVFNRYITNKNGDLVKYNGRHILLSGDSYNDWDIHDYFFADDESWFRKSNEDVYRDIEIAFYPDLIAKLQNYKKSVENFDNLISKHRLDNLFIEKSKINIGSFEWTKIKTAYPEISKAYYESEKHRLEFEELSNKSGIQYDDLKRFMKIADEEMNKFANSLNTAILTRSIITSIGSKITKLIPLPLVQAVSKTLDITSQFLKLLYNMLNIKTGNGYTVVENMHDHGLNDFRFQWKYNIENMVLIQKNWSENFRYGIQWKVSDGWFTLPRLFIRAQKHGEEDTEFFGFNWGNKVQARKKW